MPKLLASLKNASSTSPSKHLKHFAAVLHIESVVLAAVLVAAAVLVSSPLSGTS
jgi:copper resistance protein D